MHPRYQAHLTDDVEPTPSVMLFAFARRACLALLLILALAAPATAYAQPFALGDGAEGTEEAEAGFMLQVGNDVVPYTVMAAFVLPGEAVELDVMLPTGVDHFVADATAGRLDPAPGNVAWTWIAPETPGLFPVTVADTLSGERIKINAFVLTPYDHGRDRLGPYRIGRYKAKPYKNDPAYRRPQGFVRVTEANRDVRVSPHFRLGQFLSKQVNREKTFPQYALVRVPLLLKLEMILDRVREAGFDVETLHVMSGFRTPYYNRSIGNRTSYSRHLYGGAADIFVDADGNDRMDDLTGDGVVTKADARYLANLVESMRGEAWYEPLVGGLGVYGPAPHRGPFVHVDARGKPVRW
jgi:hypothetical protein